MEQPPPIGKLEHFLLTREHALLYRLAFSLDSIAQSIANIERTLRPLQSPTEKVPKEQEDE